MGKLTFCIWENLDADQLRSNRATDRCLCFRNTDSTFPLFPESVVSGLWSSARFVSDLVGNRERWFSQDMAHI